MWATLVSPEGWEIHHPFGRQGVQSSQHTSLRTAPITVIVSLRSLAPSQWSCYTLHKYKNNSRNGCNCTNLVNIYQILYFLSLVQYIVKYLKMAQNTENTSPSIPSVLLNHWTYYCTLKKLRPKLKSQLLIIRKKICTKVAVFQISCLLPWQLIITQRHPASYSEGWRGGREKYGKKWTGKG